MSRGSLPADLVLAGGGVKGIGHVGALAAMRDQDFDAYRRRFRLEAPD